MSKKNKGGKKSSAKTLAAEKNVKAAPAAQAPNKEENKKPEEKPQASAKPKGEAKPAAKPAAKKEDKKIPEPPKQKVVVVDDKDVDVKKPEEKKPEQNVATDDTVKALQQALANNNYTGLSADGRVHLFDLIRRTFVEETREELVVPKEVMVNMNAIVQAGLITMVADETVNGNSSFSVVMKSTMYPRLASAAKELGIQLPSLKLLESNTKPEYKKEGNIALPVGKGSGIKVSAEAKKQLEHDKQVQETPPELDPNKIGSEDELRKALEYLLTIKNKNVGKTLVDAVDFMRNYRMREASQAENSTQAMEKLDERSTAAWLDDIFQYVKPSFLMQGIGRGMALNLDTTGSPVRPFTILYESIKAGGEKVEWDDQSIADAVTCIIKWVTQLQIDTDKRNLEALGDPKKYDTQTKEFAEKYKAGIEKLNSRINEVLSPNSEFLDTFLDKVDKFDKNSVTLYGIIRRLYYPDTVTDENKDKKYKNLRSLIMNKVGYIFNLFRADDSKVEGYSADDLGTPVAYTDEELKAMKKEEALKK